MAEDSATTSTTTAGESETRRFAAKIVARMGTGLVYGLVGELGAGKTVFVRGAVEGLGGDAGQVRSPTFTLVNVYRAREATVYHFDLYRLGSVADLESIGFFEFAREPGSVSLVEWADRIEGIEGEIDVWVSMTTVPEGRRITVSEDARQALARRF